MRGSAIELDSRCRGLKVLFTADWVVNTQTESTIEVSLPKAFVFSAMGMLCFVAGLFFIGLPMHDPLLVGFLVVMVSGMTCVFAFSFCFMFRLKISHEGLRPAVPTFYQWVLRWEDIVDVRRARNGGMFYVVRGRRLGEFCILPPRFFLKDPQSLRRLIEQYAPADNIVRKELGR